MFPESESNCLLGDDCLIDDNEISSWNEWEDDAVLLARAQRLIRCGDYTEEAVEEEVHDGDGLTPYAMRLVRQIYDFHSDTGGASGFGLESVSGWVSRCGGVGVGVHHPVVRR